jgi:tRNA-dihydrouridine synthase A
MATAVNGIPITVKCRLGVDDFDTYELLHAFVAAVIEGSPVRHFLVHARKCMLHGLNPHQNRTIPPLRYEWVWALKRDFPSAEFSLNGCVNSLGEILAALEAPGGPTGVMVGRAAYHSPWAIMGDADRAVFGAGVNAATSRREVLWKYAEYADAMVGKWAVKEDGHLNPSVRTLAKPLMGMFGGEPRARKWRASVDEALKTAKSITELLDATLHVLLPETLDAPPVPASAAEGLEHRGPELPPTPTLAVTGTGAETGGRVAENIGKRKLQAV